MSFRIEDHPVLGPLEKVPAVTIWIDGKQVTARTGETVLAALLASEYRVLRTMPERGDPRGGFCLVGRCTDCLMVVDGQPGVIACRTIVQPDMRIETQHGHGVWSSEEAE